MQLRTLVDYIETQIYSCQDYLQKQREGELDYYTIEANHTCKELMTVIDQLKYFPQDANPTVAHMKYLRDFFEKRWERIKSTDAAYFIGANPGVTNMCLNVASILRDILKDLSCPVNLFALLMPTVYLWRSARKYREIEYYDLRNLLLTENNKHMIDIYSLKAKVADGQLTFYMKVSTTSKSVPLTLEESKMVINHCAESREYYHALISRSTDAETINLLRENLIKSQQNTRLKVTASYGEDGINRLKQRLINAGIVTLHNVRSLTSLCIKTLIKNQNIFSQPLSYAQFNVLDRHFDIEVTPKSRP